jgi:hypothetical protein
MDNRCPPVPGRRPWKVDRPRPGTSCPELLYARARIWKAAVPHLPNSGASNVAVNSPFFRLPYKPVGESDQRPNHRGQYPQLKIVQTEPVIVHYHFLTGKGFPGCLAAAEQRSPSTSVSCDDSCARLEALQLRPVAAGLTAACAPSVESVRSALSAQPRFSSLLILNCVVRRW